MIVLDCSGQKLYFSHLQSPSALSRTYCFQVTGYPWFLLKVFRISIPPVKTAELEAAFKSFIFLAVILSAHLCGSY